MKLTVLIASFLVSVYLGTASAQLGMYVAKDNRFSGLSYEKAFNDGGIDPKERLVQNGYKPNSVKWQPANFSSGSIASGKYVIVQSDYKSYDNLMSRSYGIGGSAESYEEAEKQAVINMQIYFGSWDRKAPYSVIEKNMFDFNLTRSSVVLIAIGKKDANGNKIITTNIRSGLFSEMEYSKMKQNFPSSNDKMEVKFSRVVADKGKVAIVKCIRIDPSGITTESVKMVYSPDGSSYSTTLYPDGTTTQSNESDKYFLVSEINLDQSESSTKDKLKDQLKKSVTTPQPKLQQNRSVGIGIRD